MKKMFYNLWRNKLLDERKNSFMQLLHYFTGMITSIIVNKTKELFKCIWTERKNITKNNNKTNQKSLIQSKKFVLKKVISLKNWTAKWHTWKFDDFLIEIFKFDEISLRMNILNSRPTSSWKRISFLRFDWYNKKEIDRYEEFWFLETQVYGHLANINLFFTETY